MEAAEKNMKVAKRRSASDTTCRKKAKTFFSPIVAVTVGVATVVNVGAFNIGCRRCQRLQTCRHRRRCQRRRRHHHRFKPSNDVPSFPVVFPIQNPSRIFLLLNGFRPRGPDV